MSSVFAQSVTDGPSLGDPLVGLPLDWPRPGVRIAREAGIDIPVGEELGRGLDRLAEAEGLNGDRIWLSVLSALLFRLAGRCELRIALLGEDPRKATAVPVTVGDRWTFRRLMHEVNEAASVGGQPQLELTTDNGETGSAPLFHAALRWTTAVSDGTQGCLEWADLALVRAGSVARLMVNAEIFAETTGWRWADHIGLLLGGIIHDPATPVARLPLLGTDDRHRMLVEWNRTKRTFPDRRSFLGRIVELARSRPDDIAVVGGTERVTYRALVSRAHQLAHHLKTTVSSTSALSRIGICLPRSADKMVAHLAVLATGGSIVLLDPGQPAERLAGMLSDAGVAVILTHERLLPALPNTAPRTVCLDRDHAAIAAQPTHPPSGPSQRPEDVAYVVYTSGSAGEPKAALLPNRAIDHVVDVMREALGLTGTPRLAWLSGPGYGIVIAEVLPYLAMGAQVHVAEPEQIDGPTCLRDWMLAESITDAVIVTPLAEQLLALSWPVPTPLQRMVVFGDRLRCWPPGDLPFEVITLYGSAEATCVACTHHADERLRIDLATDSVEQRSVRVPPGGRALPNVRTYVLDEQRQPVPPMVVGELFVAGHGLALGYLDRPGLTRDTFIPSPLDEEPDPVVYRTGDLARYRPDGVLEVLGRADQQVKIRGFRVELGEVESALARQDGVGQVVVVAREDERGNRRLVAYVVPDPHRRPAVDQLRQALRASLPAFMIPAAFVYLDSFPTNAHGKVDRRALPAPSEQRGHFSVPFEAPQGEIDRWLADVWSAVLKVHPVGVHDSFFDLGGDSLTAIEVTRGVRERLGCDLPLIAFLEAPTVAQMAVMVLDELIVRATSGEAGEAIPGGAT